MVAEKPIDMNRFNELMAQGLNCKEIANNLGLHPHTLGKKFEQIMGIYPSQYIAQNYKKQNYRKIKNKPVS